MFNALDESSNPYTYLFILFRKTKNVVRLLKEYMKKTKEKAVTYTNRENTDLFMV